MYHLYHRRSPFSVHCGATIAAVGALTFFCARPVFASNPANTTAGASLGSARTWAPASRRFADSSIFAPLTVPPAPSSTRLATGAPGPKYWQNRADYDIQATLDTAAHSLRASMTLRYTNNSPDTLKTFWFQTEQRDETIDRFDQIVHGHSVALTRQHPNGDIFELQVTPAEPLPPGRTATFQVQWSFLVPDPNGFMGRTGSLYQIAQWYPRPNVYDDVKGWNTESLATGGEFYLEYGDFSLALTLPSGYIVAATGTLENPRDVLTAAERTRLAQAIKADTPVAIVTAAELASGAARPKQTGTLTWKFHVHNTRDAVWAAAPNYLWDATSWHGILAQGFYRPQAGPGWQHGEAATHAQMSIQDYSERWYPYPYPQVSVAEGSVTGEEYPMLTFVGDLSKMAHPERVGIDGGGGRSTAVALQYAVTTHEVGHNWFPMIVGSNERIYAWMDEGFNTFINTFSEAHRYPADGDQPSRITHQVLTGQGILIRQDAYGATAYLLNVLRQDVLGPAVFDSAFRTYIRRWAYKHPTPQDFFRTMEDVSGQHLEWFWHDGFLEASRFDQAIDSVTQTVQGGETHVTVTYGNKGSAVMPLLVHFTFSDSTTRDVTYPADVWRADPTQYTVTYTFPSSVRRIELDSSQHLPDADRANNSWTAP